MSRLPLVPVSRKFGISRLFVVGALVVILGVLTLSRFYTEYQRVRDRGRMVASLVREQRRTLLAEPIGAPPLEHGLIQRGYLRTDSPALARWLALALVRSSEPTEVSAVLRKLSEKAKEQSPIAVALARWSYGITRWSEFLKREPALDTQNLLAEAHRRYYEAIGYQKVGRAYDATVLFLWSSTLLSDYILRDPIGDNVPEALFFLGESYSRLGHALGSDEAGRRFLKLCAELYSDDVWAGQAAYWIPRPISDDT